MLYHQVDDPLPYPKLEILRVLYLAWVEHQRLAVFVVVVGVDLVIQLVFNELFWISVLFCDLTLIEKLLELSWEAICQVVGQEQDGFDHAIILQHLDHLLARVAFSHGRSEKCLPDVSWGLHTPQIRGRENFDRVTLYSFVDWVHYLVMLRHLRIIQALHEIHPLLELYRFYFGHFELVHVYFKELAHN